MHSPLILCIAGHCRRRKLRCEVVPDEFPQQCTRYTLLKKEFDFPLALGFARLPKPVVRSTNPEKIMITTTYFFLFSASASPGTIISRKNRFAPILQRLQILIADVYKGSVNCRASEFIDDNDRQHWESSNIDHRGSPTGPYQACWNLTEPSMMPVFPFQVSESFSSTAHLSRESVDNFTTSTPPREDYGWPLPPGPMSFDLLAQVQEENPAMVDLSPGFY